MGYRSDVVYGIQFPDKAAVAAYMTKLRLTTDNKNAEFDKLNVSSGCGDAVLVWFSESSVKWYEDHYEDVQWHMALIAQASAAGLPTYFVRVGEDFDDIQREETNDGGFLSDYLGVNCTVYVPDGQPYTSLKDMFSEEAHDESE